RTIVESPSVYANEYRWTAILAFCSGTIALCVGWWIARTLQPRVVRSRTWRLFAWIVFSGFVILAFVPGPVIGTALQRFFSMPIAGFGTIYHRTLIPILMGLAPRTILAAAAVMIAGYRMRSAQIFSAGQIDGASGWRQFWYLELGPMKTSAIAATLAASVLAVSDIPAVLTVCPPGVSTVGTRLFELLHSGVRYQQSGLAIWFCVGYFTLITALIRLSIHKSTIKQIA
ncbi:MAG: hypothetical protein AAFN70_18595, partial [Planctomycetota bacterium]